MNTWCRRPGVALLLAALYQLQPGVCSAQTSPQQDQAKSSRSQWRDRWPTFSWVEGLATVAAGAGTLALALQPPPQEARWQGGILLDNAVRGALRLGSASGRQRARSIGDLTYRTAPAIPLLIDPLIVALAVRGDSKAAVNLAGVGLEAFSYAGLLSFVSTRISARERPDISECRRQNPDGGGCGADTQSFWSGHSSIAATSAGLTCANHRNMRLWGHAVADAAACVLTSGAALTTGVSRIAADRHYATDVLLGMGVGFGIGYAVPVLLHYSRGKPGMTLSLAPCTGRCLSLSGSF